MATINNYIKLSTNIPDAMDRAAQATRKASNGMNNLSDRMKKVASGSTAMSERMGGAFQMMIGSLAASAITTALSTIQNGISSLMGTAEEYAGIQARMNLVTGSQQNAIILNERIYQSAQKARGGYLDMANAVSQLAMSAHDAFPDPREAVDFMEGVQKLFVIGGSSKEAQKNAMLQLTQGMASGQLQGDEFRSIAENAPLIENIIAKTMGVSRGELKQLAAEGKVTAEVIKKAIGENMEEINAQFETMPKRWGDHFTMIQNRALKAFTPVFEGISQLANSDAVRQAVEGIAEALEALAPVFWIIVRGVNAAINTIVWAFSGMANFVRNHMVALKIAAVVLAGAITALVIPLASSAFAMGAAAAATIAKTIADFAETAAIRALTVAQDGLNVALAECPITWIIAGIVAIVALVFLAVDVFNYFADTSVSVTGLVGGLFGILGGVIYNTVVFVWNIFAALANFFANVFRDPLAAVANLFIDIWNGIVGYVKAAVNAIIDLIGNIPGIKSVIGGAIDHIGENVLQAEHFAVSGGEVTVAQKMEYGNISEFAQTGYEIGDGIGDRIGDMLKTPDISNPGEYDASKIESGAGKDGAAGGSGGKEAAKNAKQTADNTKRIADKVDMTETEIKELRDAAVRSALSKFTKQNTVVNISNDVTINNDTDMDGFVSDLRKGIEQAVNGQRQGVGI